jgi:hypothetical protein
MVVMMNKRPQTFPLFSNRWLALCLAGITSIGLYGWLQVQPVIAGDTLSPFEQSLFSRDYAGESTPARLDRLESSVFGEAQPGSVAEREARLVKALSEARSYIPKASTGKEEDAQGSPEHPSGITQYTSGGGSAGHSALGAGNENQPAYGSRSTSEQRNPAPAGDSDYPTVTALEREIFGRDFLREDVAHRLDRLENRAFGQASPQLGLSDRVDRLMALYPGAAADVARYTHSAGGDSGVSSSIRDLPSDSSQLVGGMDAYAKVSALEKKILNGRTYSGELLTQRLDRLETRAYGKTYAGQGVETRVNRLISAYRVTPKAAPSVPNDLLRQPDPAKWQSPQHQGYTGSFLSQRGGTANYGGSPGSISPAPAPAPQNIQIGAGFGQSTTSSGTYGGYSQEMISMLSPGMQQQLGVGGTQQQSSTVIGAPGTVITQETTSYPAFQPYGQPYGGQPFQTYNYYGNPQIQSQTQSTTTVIQPNGATVTGPTTTVITQPGMSTGLNGLPTPVYIGDPTVLQTLGNLEANLYGAVDLVNPVSIRLNRLETSLLQQIYPSLPDAQRVANLQRAYQLQSVGNMLGKSKAANIGRAAGSMLFGVPLTPGMVGTPVGTPITAPAQVIMPAQ